jgi:UDP-2,3-diacylglucosamine hydrolase
MTNLSLQDNKRIYFVSDAHLGHPPAEQSLKREKLLIKWLDEIKSSAHSLYLLGDIFDYWFEYRKVVPRGFVRLLGKLAEFSDSGIPVHFFTGNHDVWIFDYLPEEIGITVHRKPLILNINHKRLLIAHGDGLGPGEYGYKLLKLIFTSKIMQWLFARIHPNTGTGFAHRWSKHSRLSKESSKNFLGEDREHLVLFAKKILLNEYFDYFIFGHRHLPFDLIVNKKSHVISLGDWFIHFTYAVFDGNEVKLINYPVEKNMDFIFD